MMTYAFHPPLTRVERGLIGYALESGIGGYDDPKLAAHCFRAAERARWSQKLLAELTGGMVRALPSSCAKCGYRGFDIIRGAAKCAKCGEPA